MKGIALLVLSVLGIQASAQFGYPVIANQTPIDSTLLWIENEVQTIDKSQGQEKVVLPDSMFKAMTFYKQENKDEGHLFLNPNYQWDTVPQAYTQNGAIVKIEFSGFTFHYSSGMLIRSMALCGQSAGWSRCNGYTSAQFYWYYDNGHVHRELMIQQYDRECACYLNYWIPNEWVAELYASFSELIDKT